MEELEAVRLAIAKIEPMSRNVELHSDVSHAASMAVEWLEQLKAALTAYPPTVS